jgi:hypothetical protein
MSLRNWKHEAGGTEAKKAFADAILKKLITEISGIGSGIQQSSQNGSN